MTSGILRGLVVVAAVLSAGGSAFADPVVTRVATKRTKNRRLDVTIDVSADKGGMLDLSGTLTADSESGPLAKAVKVRKRLRPGSRSVTLKIDAKKARFRRVTGDLQFNLTVTATEKGGAAPVQRPLRTTIPVPLLLLPGLGNEQTPGGFESFGEALDNVAGGVYQYVPAVPEGIPGVPPAPARGSLAIQEYESLTGTLADHAALVEAKATALLKGSIFTKIDVVGYSMGGIVARDFGTSRGRGRIRRMIFVCTPNEGAPIAYIGATAAKSGQLGALLPPELAGSGFDGFLDAIFAPESLEAIRTLYPTYDWATADVFGFPVPVTAFLPDAQTPLEDLNERSPDTACAYHGLYYSALLPDVLPVDFGTIDQVDVTSFLANGQFNAASLTTLATGDGDGVVPAHSVTMDETPLWRGSIAAHDLGPGTHLTATLDGAVLTTIASILRE